MADGDALIEIQGEHFSTTNDSAIHGVTEYDSDVDPYTVGETQLNTLDSDSFNTAGQKVTYTFKVEKEGNYKIGMIIVSQKKQTSQYLQILRLTEKFLMKHSVLML